MNMNALRKILIATAVLAPLLLSACATTPASPEDIVRERAQLRWDSILSRDYATAYELYSPGYRSQATPVDFEISMRLRSVRWTSAEFYSVECGENTCEVTFKVGWRVNTPVPGVAVYNGSSYIPGQWVRTRGEWWYRPTED